MIAYRQIARRNRNDKISDYQDIPTSRDQWYPRLPVGSPVTPQEGFGKYQSMSPNTLTRPDTGFPFTRVPFRCDKMPSGYRKMTSLIRLKYGRK